MSNETKVQASSGDMHITISGKSEIFGGVDLSLEAAKTIIEGLDFKFAQDKDYDFPQKAHIQIVDALGSSIKSLGFDPRDQPNIIVVQQFLNWFIDEAKLHEAPEYRRLLDKDENDDFEFDFELK
ncbi:hypothetical protein [Paenibacillus illinoisensis]|uniref:Uncharacterized protein n=1 Tax=Paenibacillus illinoisensis TaxID=59845 RepID=A0A2W0C732_9BACL|nr:hypothetical protein [Paenibacillus illinoisensis]PYY28300.1 Uncharacterized protein PIL02S_03451 [Paenibacillus illinoisensis]